MDKFKLIIVLFFLLFNNNSYTKENLNPDLQKHINSLVNFSANFIQINFDSLSEGKISLNKERIKIEYLKPKKITIIIAPNKAMYFNIDLQEVQYFNPENSPVGVFYDIFFNKIFLQDSDILDLNSSINLSKKIIYEDKNYEISLTFEKKPFILRKIQITGDDEKISLGINNYNFNPKFSKNFFSMANPLIR